MDESLIKVVYGEKKLEPVEYRVVSRVEGPWWRRQTLHYVETDYMITGPYYSASEAQAAAHRMRSYG